MKKLILFAFLFAFGVMNANALQITSRLQQKMNSLNPLQYTRVLILLSDQVDIDRLDADLYRMNASLQYRAYTVITQLQQKALNTQGPLLQFLNAEKGAGKVKLLQNYWVTNLIMAEVTSDVLNQLTYRNDIQVLDLDDVCFLDKPVSILPDNKSKNSIESVETGLKVIRADSLWRLGYSGAGSTVMNIDNGVNGTHPALNPKWWGNNGRPWYWSWYNVRTPSVTFPNACAGDFHGTHTMGIMCGSSSSTGDTVGVAPGARWIAAAVTDCPGAVYPSDNVTAFQWGMNPDSNAATNDDMPTVISCSWQDPNASDQCTTSIYRTLLASVEAAGIGVVFSAGNSGPGASTCTPPKNINIDSINVMCVGAVDANTAGYPIASFSSRGPSICGGTGTLLIKPEVSAPGNNVRSSYSGTGYSLLSGTSMASPHVAGAIALLKQVNPNMTGKQLKAILFSTCTDLGIPGEDNDYGKGLINIMAAYRRMASYPLSSFNILTPSAGTRIVTVPGDNTPVTITWDTSATGANYKFIFGNPTVSTRRFSIASSSNSITTTLGQLDALLAASGFTNNGTASDSAAGQFTIWAYKGASAPGPDSLSAANGPRAITFRRQQIVISAFSLISPNSGTSITTSPVDPTPLNISWRRSGSGGSTYRWLFKNGASYSDPAYLRILSNNSGLDTGLTIRYSQVDSLLASMGVAPGDSVTGYWRVRAYTSSDSVNSTAPDRQLTLRRASLLPLFQQFTDATMPPAFWTLSQGSAATQYWSLVTFSAYGSSTPGCAKYNFWSASASTGPQTLTSNQFPAVTTGINYLRFNEACAYYSATAIDSCIIETSTNAGGSWNRLIGMYQSLTLSSGYNSTPVMTTVSATAQFLTPTAGQWATKIFTMPVGTNMVRFIAKSAFGNNLYIDDITSGTATGVGEPLSFIPERYELSQNYPNPFNPTTKINFSLPKQGLVTLKIYDMLGKEIAELVNEVRVAGNYSVDFNAGSLASGVYFYRIESADFKDTKRMLLVK